MYAPYDRHGECFVALANPRLVAGLKFFLVRAACAAWAHACGGKLCAPAENPSRNSIARRAARSKKFITATAPRRKPRGRYNARCPGCYNTADIHLTAIPAQVTRMHIVLRVHGARPCPHAVSSPSTGRS
jgi:hypothetical protein